VENLRDTRIERRHAGAAFQADSRLKPQRPVKSKRSPTVIRLSET